MAQSIPMQPGIGFPPDSEVDLLRKLVWNTMVLAQQEAGDVASVNGATGVVVIFNNQSATVGSNILRGDGLGGFADVTVARGLTYSAGSLAEGAAPQAIAALNIDWSLGTVFSKTLSASSTFTFSNDTTGWTIVVALTNTASNYTVTWPGSVVWSGGVAPTQTVGAKTDVYTFIKIGSVVYGSVVQNF